MSTISQQIVTNTTLNVEMLNSISLVDIDSETLDINLNDKNIGYIIYADNSLEINSDDYTFTESELSLIEKKANEFLGDPVKEEVEQYTSYDQMYGVNNAMFI